jgi:hypothetical protein
MRILTKSSYLFRKENDENIDHKIVFKLLWQVFEKICSGTGKPVYRRCKKMFKQVNDPGYVPRPIIAKS